MRTPPPATAQARACARRPMTRTGIAGPAALALALTAAALPAAAVAPPRAGQSAPRAAAPDPFGGDPLRSHQWEVMRKDFLGARTRVEFDDRIVLTVPRFADDPMNVPVTVDARRIPGARRVMVLVDRNPIRKVLEFEPGRALPMLSFRFKLEQASPIRAVVQDAAGAWHVGSAMIDASGGGCTVPGATRADGSWTRQLGEVQAQVYPVAAASAFRARLAEGEDRGTAGDGTAAHPPAASAPAAVTAPAARLKLRIMHPMDTGLVAGIPAFHLSALRIEDAAGGSVMALKLFEPVSENPVFSLDLPEPPAGTLRVRGRDNNGNRVAAEVAP